MGQVLVDLSYHDIFEASCEKLVVGDPLVSAACSGGPVMTLGEGLIYPCVDAFREKKALARFSDEIDGDQIVAGRVEYTAKKEGCLICRERAVKSLVGYSLPEETNHEVGALLYHFGTLRQEADDHAGAIDNFEQSLKVSAPEESGSICFRLGLSYTRMGDLDGALKAFRRAEPALRDHDYFQFHLGLCYFESAEHQLALGAFREALRLGPQQEDLVRILIYVGSCHNYLGEYKEAGLALEEAKKIAPEVKEIYNALGFTYFQIKEYDRAIENLQRAVEIDPHSAIDFASLGANYREKGEVSRAIAMYEKALSLDPTITSARENLERLKDSS
jgi:tetratricopeptide (TPR) repeat protein